METQFLQKRIQILHTNSPCKDSRMPYIWDIQPVTRGAAI